MRKGFTLIELLVVVLIIGILAAVALPQYTKTVMKSRASQAIVSLNAVYNSLERHYLENNAWPTFSGNNNPTADAMNEVLDIDVILPKNFNYVYYSDFYIGVEYFTTSSRFTIAKGISDIYQGSQFERGVSFCWAYDGDTNANENGRSLCKSLCGELTEYTSGLVTFYCIMK